MKRTTIVLWILILAAALTACQKDASAVVGGTRGNGAFSFSQVPSDEQIEYVLNTASRRIHLPDCRHVQKIQEANRRSVSDVSQAKAEGYTPCGDCFSDPLDTNVKEEDTKK